MRALMKIEFSRAFCNKWMAISLAIGCGMALLNAADAALGATEWLRASYDAGMLPPTVFDHVFGMRMLLPNTMFYYILPILAALPFVDTFYTDVKSGYVKNVFIRTKKRDYLTAKGLAVFLSAFAAIAIPLLLNLFATAMLLPSVLPDATAQRSYITANSMWADMFYANPYRYILLYSLITSTFAGLFTLLGLAVSRFVINRFLVLIVPFVVYFSASTLFNILRIQRFNPFAFMQSKQSGDYTSVSLFLAMALLLLLPTLILYFVKGLRDETF